MATLIRSWAELLARHRHGAKLPDGVDALLTNADEAKAAEIVRRAREHQMRKSEERKAREDAFVKRQAEKVRNLQQRSEEKEEQLDNWRRKKEEQLRRKREQEDRLYNEIMQRDAEIERKRQETIIQLKRELRQKLENRRAKKKANEINCPSLNGYEANDIESDPPTVIQYVHRHVHRHIHLHEGDEVTDDIKHQVERSAEEFLLAGLVKIPHCKPSSLPPVVTQKLQPYMNISKVINKY